MGEDSQAVDDETTEIYDRQVTVSRCVDKLKKEYLSERTPAVIYSAGSKLRELFKKMCLRFKRYRDKNDKKAKRIAKKEERRKKSSEFDQWFFK